MRQFSLRNLLLFTAIIAMALAWILHRHPRQAGFEVHLRSGRAFTVDAATGRVWRETNSENDSTANDSE
jgi:hypothetical protein